MKAAPLTKHLLLNDLKLIGRDQTLALMLALGVVLAVAMRYLLPLIDATLAERGVLPNATLDARLSDAFPMLVTFLGFFNGAQLPGVIFGFLLLEEKDQRTLPAIEVSPTPIDRYLVCRLALPAVLAFITSATMVLIINQAVLPTWQVVLLALMACPTAPIFALFLCALAENKIQGFAVSKFLGIAGWTILIGWFVAPPWQWLFAVFPQFLVCKAYWMALEGAPLWWLTGLIGLTLQLALLAAMARGFHRARQRELGG